MHPRAKEGFAVLLLFAAIYVTLSLVTYHPADPSFNVAGPTATVQNSAGLLGAYLSDFILQTFGFAAFILPVVLLVHMYQIFIHREGRDTTLRMLTLPLMLISCSVIAQMWNVPSSEMIGSGGLVGLLATNVMTPIVGKFGVGALAFITLLLSTMWWSGLTFVDLANYSLKLWHWVKVISLHACRVLKRFKFKNSLQIDLPLAPREKKIKPKVQRSEPQKEEKKAKRKEAEKQVSLPLDLGGDGYTMPPLHVLDENTQEFKGEGESALQQNARRIETELANFGVKGVVVNICPGPVITIYELEPAPGVKTSTVVGLANDLARAMSATAIRIASIPGRSVIGIEVPNLKRQMVTLKELLETEKFETNTGKLAVALGVDTAGFPIYTDIAKMPHALIAGTTGSGKSVAMNAFILSLLYRMSPEQLKFVMVDPKMLELSIYNDIPHLITPVITDPHKASTALKWVVREMEDRYRMMAELGVKNIQSFNVKFAEMQERNETPVRMVQTGFNPQTGQPLMEEKPLCEKALPYIVVVIDELADLMMVAGKEVEQSIARLAQMARASGIHLLIATQRPSVDVITGLIKANVPTRISFNVTSKIDSRTVLDSMGAEQLLGKGDMLFMENGSNSLRRLHGAFVSEDECNAVAAHLRKQSKPDYIEDMFKAPMGGSVGGGSEAGVDDNDPTYRQAIEIVAKEQKASTSFIQRHLKIGYNRAASLIEKMEQDGLVGPANHVGKREVIVKQPPQGGY